MITFEVYRWDNAHGGMRFAFPPYGLAGQFSHIQDIITKHAFEVVNFGLSKDLEKQEITVNFLLRIRTSHPDRQVLQEVFELPGVKRVDLI